MRPRPFFWPGLRRAEEDHPEPPRTVFRLPPPEFGGNWQFQHGVHDAAFDPCGPLTPRLKVKDAATRSET